MPHYFLPFKDQILRLDPTLKRVSLDQVLQAQFTQEMRTKDDQARREWEERRSRKHRKRGASIPPFSVKTRKRLERMGFLDSKTPPSRNIHLEDRTEIAKIERVMRLLPETDISTLIPTGGVFLESAGYNGYTGGGLWNDPHRISPLREKLASTSRDYLFGEGFLGSSNHVYVPGLPVRVASAPRETSTKSRPELLLFYRGRYVPAKYDLKQATFVPTKSQNYYTPAFLVLKSEPRQLSEYLKPRGEILSYFSQGTNDRKIPNRKVVENSCYAAFAELKAVLSHFQEELNNNDPSLFNRFLLYKAFERTIVGNHGLFIVGQMQGDSQNIHLPYVAVAKRA